MAETLTLRGVLKGHEGWCACEPPRAAAAATGHEGSSAPALAYVALPRARPC
jgi:hypothetical protein